MAIGFFDGDKANASPESIKRKRELIARLMSGGRAPRDVGEGLHAIGQGLQAAVLGSRADSAEQAGNAERSRIMAGILGGGAPMAAVGGAPVATGSATGSGATDDTYTGAPRGLFSSESGGRFNAQNNATGAGGMKGHFGRVQFGQARLQEAASAGAIPQGTTPQQFMASPELQRAAERWHFADIDNRIKASGIDQKFGQTINGVPITRDGLVAVAHLGGIKGMQRFVETGGRYNPRDVNGTSLMDYFARMGGQSRAASNMPVIRPGNNAAPMPLARQQAQTAPMPNAGLADMPAPGANQSALEARPVAPVSGDNPQQLLADAAYYEQNGNPEAARQMRERAAMAGQPAPEAAFMVPPDGGQTNPLRDMFSARGVGFADNESDVQGQEARMAQEQAAMPVQAPDPVQTVAITPNAQNNSDVFSPIPMGLGGNPFMPSAPVDMAQAPAERPPMDRATFDQITSAGAPLNPAFMAEGINPSWGGQNADVAAPGAVEVSGPRQVQAPMPPPRPSDLGPQSPFVPPAMRQPMPVDMGGENGASPMQFIESEFARREGRPDPRMAMGAPVAQAPQMPAGAPPMPVGGQSAPMGGEPAAQGQAQAQAQAPAQRPGMIPERDLVAVLSSRFTTPEDKRFAMDLLNQQRAMAQAEAERARTQQANEAAARAAGIDPALMGNPVIAQQAAAARFNNRTENLSATNQAREAEGRRMGLQGPALQQYTLTGQLPNAANNENKIAAETRAREADAARIGLKPGDPRYQTFVLTGKMPREDAQPLSATDKKAILEADEGVLAGETAIKALNDAKALSPRANQGWGASTRATIGNNLPDWMVPDIVSSPQSSKDTAVYENVVLGQALSQLKSIFGAAPTEGERQILLDLQASVSKPDKVRQELLNTATGLAEKRLAFNRQRAAELRGGDFYKPENKRGGQSSPQAGPSSPAQSGAALQSAREAIAKGAPRETVIDRLRQAGIDPGGL